MATISFKANRSDYINNSYPYINIKIDGIESLRSSNSICLISQGNDITQFLCETNKKFRVDLFHSDGNSILVGRTFTFNELKDSAINYGIYQSGPTLVDPNNFQWILYSVSKKLPVDAINDNVPPPGNSKAVKVGVAQLITVEPKNYHSLDPLDRYLEVYFIRPQGEGRYSISFESTQNDNIYATRIIGHQFEWKFTPTTSSAKNPQTTFNSLLIKDLNLDFVLL